MLRFIHIAVVSFLILSMPSIAKADLIMTFAALHGTPQNLFSINSIGGTIDIAIYLNQTSPTTILSDVGEGLFSAAFRLDYGTGGGSFAHVASTSDVTPNPGFDLSADAVLETDAVTLDEASKTSVFGEPGDPDRIKLGVFRFTALSPGSLTLSLMDLDPGVDVDNFVSWSGAVLDSSIDFSTTATLNITAVPEPGSFPAVVLALAGIITWRRHRRMTSL